MRTYNTISQIFVSPNVPAGLSGQSAEINGADGPFSSVNEAVSFISELRRSGIGQPIAIRLLDGVYNFSSPLVFTPEAVNFTVESYSGNADKVVISGAKRIVGFEKSQFIRPDGSTVECFAAYIPEVKDGTFSFTDFYVDGMRAQYSRYPESGMLKFDSVENSMGALFASSKWVKVKTEDIECISDASLKNAVLSYFHFWIDEHTEIDAFDRTEGKISMRRISRFSMLSDTDYILENVRETFGRPNEWYLDNESGMLYYVPRDSSMSAESICAYAPLTASLFSFFGNSEARVKNIRLRGITLANTRGDYVITRGTDGNEDADPMIYASDSQGVSNAVGVINMTFAENCEIENCKFLNYGLYGVDIRDACQNISVTGCDFYDGGAGGVKANGGTSQTDSTLHTHDIIISNNIIKHCGRRHMAACGVILMNAYNCRVEHNEICDLFYTGISGGWVWGYSPSVSRNNLIRYNHIYNLGQGILSDMGGVYLLAAQPGTIVAGNLIHDIKSRYYGGWALYTDEGSGYVTLEDNICYNTSDNCYHQHYGRMNTVRNNIFAFAGKEIMRISRFEGHLSIIFEQNIILTDGCPIYGVSDRHLACATMACGNNIVWSVGGSEPVFAENGKKKYTLADFKAFGLENGSIVCDPMLKDPINYDFTPDENSPAYDMGFRPIDMHGVGADRK